MFITTDLAVEWSEQFQKYMHMVTIAFDVRIMKK